MLRHRTQKPSSHAADNVSLMELMSSLRGGIVDDTTTTKSTNAIIGGGGSSSSRNRPSAPGHVDFFFETEDDEATEAADEPNDGYLLNDVPTQAPPAPQEPSNIEEELAYLDNLIRVVYPDKINALEKFREVLSSREMAQYFDVDDIKWVTEDLEHQKAELARIQDSWSKTASVYRDTYLRLKDTIEMRQMVLNALDRETNIFLQRPQLIDRFAEKQAKLSTLMDECCERIRVEQKEVQKRVEAEQREMQAIIDSASAMTVNTSSSSSSVPPPQQPPPLHRKRSKTAAAAGATTTTTTQPVSTTKKKKKVRFIDDQQHHKQDKQRRQQQRDYY